MIPGFPTEVGNYYQLTPRALINLSKVINQPLKGFSISCKLFQVR
jgi:hypothetical protein